MYLIPNRCINLFHPKSPSSALGWLMKATAILLLDSLSIPTAISVQGFKSSIKHCGRDAYDVMEGECQYTFTAKSEVKHSGASKNFIQECKTTYARRINSWSRRLVDRIVSEEYKSKVKEPEIIIEYPENWW